MVTLTARTVSSGLIPVSPYRLDPGDLAAVGAYRAKRWGP